MRNKVAKRMRRMVDPVNPVGRRVYRRLKKHYNTVPRAARSAFLEKAEQILTARFIDETKDEAEQG